MIRLLELESIALLVVGPFLFVILFKVNCATHTRQTPWRKRHSSWLAPQSKEHLPQGN
jgi:hypothetical protein